MPTTPDDPTRCEYVVALAGHDLRRCGSTEDVQPVEVDGATEARCRDHR